MGYQAFTEAVLLMSVFEQRLSFRILYFMTNGHVIIVKCRWVSGDALSSVVGSWRRLGGSSGGKCPEKVWSFYSWRANK